MSDFSQSECLTHIFTGPNVMEMFSMLVGPNISPHYISITLPHYISNVITYATILVGSPPDLSNTFSYMKYILRNHCESLFLCKH